MRPDLTIHLCLRVIVWQLSVWSAKTCDWFRVSKFRNKHDLKTIYLVSKNFWHYLLNFLYYIKLWVYNLAIKLHLIERKYLTDNQWALNVLYFCIGTILLWRMSRVSSNRSKLVIFFSWQVYYYNIYGCIIPLLLSNQ